MTEDQFNELVDHVQQLQTKTDSLADSIATVDTKVERTKYLSRLFDVNVAYPAENDILVYDKTGKWKNAQYDEVGLEPGEGGGGSSDIYVIGIGDDTLPTNENVYSAARTIEDWVSSKNPDDVEGTLTFKNGAKIIVDGIQSTKMTQGTTLGSGFLYSIDSSNNSYLEIDSLCVRKTALFNELEIKKVTSIGGSLVVSPANNTIIRVDEVSAIYNGESQTVWRCYYRNVDEDKEEAITTDFQAGDLAKIQTFNINGAGIYENISNRYYWGLVLGTGSNSIGGYIDLSQTDKDPLSNAGPQAGDALVMYGNKNDSKRQNVIDITTYANNAPAISLFQGINDYTTADKVVIEMAYDRDQTQNQAYFNVFGRAYIGAKDEHTFVKYDPTANNGQGLLTVRGKVILENGQTTEEYVKDNAAGDLGITNLLINSKLDNLDGWQINYAATIVEFDGYTCLKATGSYRGIYTAPTANARLIPNEGTITNSIDVYATAPCTITVGIQGMETNRIQVTETNKWVRVNNTQVLNNNKDSYVIYTTGTEAVVYFKDAKCELGTTATGWTPSSEDLKNFSENNLVLNGRYNLSNVTAYNLKRIYTSKELTVGKQYTAILSGDVGGEQKFGLYDSQSLQELGFFTKKSGRIYSLTFVFNQRSGSRANQLTLYNTPQETSSSNPADVDWLCIYEGNVNAPDFFVPAKEDTSTLVAEGGHWGAEKSAVTLNGVPQIVERGSDGANRGLHLWKLDTLQMKVTFLDSFDVYADEEAKTNFVTELNKITGDNIAIVTSCDSISITEAMQTALNNFGADAELLEQSRTSLVLIGKKGLGQGNGIFHTSTTNAISVSTMIFNGTCTGFNSNGDFVSYKHDTKAWMENTERSISLHAQDIETINGSITSINKSVFTVLPEQIASKVSSDDFKGEKIVSMINQTAAAVTISAQKINLEGAVTFSMFNSETQGKINSAEQDAADAKAKIEDANKRVDEVEKELGKKLDTETIIVGGYINTSLIDADAIFANIATIGGFFINEYNLSNEGTVIEDGESKQVINDSSIRIWYSGDTFANFGRSAASGNTALISARADDSIVASFETYGINAKALKVFCNGRGEGMALESHGNVTFNIRSGEEFFVDGRARFNDFCLADPTDSTTYDNGDVNLICPHYTGSLLVTNSNFTLPSVSGNRGKVIFVAAPGESSITVKAAGSDRIWHQPRNGNVPGTEALITTGACIFVAVSNVVYRHDGRNIRQNNCWLGFPCNN